MEAIEFSDIEAAAVARLASDLATRLPSCKVAASIPSPRPDEFVTVRRVGGVATSLVVDAPAVAFECWSSSGSAAAALAALVRAIVRSWQGEDVGGLTVYKVQESAGPASLPDPVSHQPRYTFTDVLHVRGVAL